MTDEALEFRLIPVDKTMEEIKAETHKKSRAEIRAELGIRDDRSKRSRRR